MGGRLKVGTRYLRIENAMLGKTWRLPVGGRTGVPV